MREITSTSNAQFKVWRSLLNSRGIKSEGLFILSGEKIIQEFLKDPFFEIECELVMKDQIPVQTKAPIFELSKDLHSELDIVGTRFNLLVLKSKLLPTSSAQDKIDGLEVIIPIGDPNNLGALIRSCVAFGVSRIHLTTESAHPFHPKALKASAGSILRAPLFLAGPIAEWDHSSVLALDSKGDSILTVKKNRPNSKVRILVGEEGPGLPPLSNVTKISIPTQNVESLNATVAASLVIWHLASEN